MNEKSENKSKIVLTPEEENFCILYVHGGVKFAGKHCPCYRDAFQTDRENVSVISRKLLGQPHIIDRIKELTSQAEADVETVAVKLQVAETLKAVLEETATSSFMDKFGVELSPAPLRAVSVNAAKALMTLFPIKNQDTQQRGDQQCGVTINVVVPTPTVNTEENET